MNRLGLATIAAVVSCASSTTVAGAHVRVFPEMPGATVAACSYAKFVVRVPVEKPIETTGVRVVIPKNVIVFATQPKAGWTAKFSMDRGRVAAIEWSGGKLEPHEFDEFAFLAATPREPGTLNWDADQTYSDGSIVHWTGAPGTETPHSQTAVVADVSNCRNLQRKK